MRPHGTPTRYVSGCRCALCRGANAEAKVRRREATRLEPDDPRHGTVNGYGNLGCRCDRCRRAVADARANFTLPPDDPRHGRTSTYCSGCRCQPCRDAMSSYVWARRAKAAREKLR